MESGLVVDASVSRRGTVSGKQDKERIAALEAELMRVNDELTTAKKMDGRRASEAASADKQRIALLEAELAASKRYAMPDPHEGGGIWKLLESWAALGCMAPCSRKEAVRK